MPYFRRPGHICCEKTLVSPRKKDFPCLKLYSKKAQLFLYLKCAIKIDSAEIAETFNYNSFTNMMGFQDLVTQILKDMILLCIMCCNKAVCLECSSLAAHSNLFRKVCL